LVSDLAGLRNSAAHGYDLGITEETAIEYVNVARRVAADIDALTEGLDLTQRGEEGGDGHP
jgi:hypothetical protein